MGIAAGFAGAFGLLLLIDNLDHTVKSADTLRNLGIPVLCRCPKMLDVEKTKKNRRKSLIPVSGAGYIFPRYLPCSVSRRPENFFRRLLKNSHLAAVVPLEVQCSMF